MKKIPRKYYLKKRIRCEHGKHLKNEIVDILSKSSYNLTSSKSFDSVKILEYFAQPSRKLNSSIVIEKIKDFQEVEYHKSVAEMQRISYNKDCEDFELLSSSILIVFDFKEKIIVGT
jgi:hypothetical protein